MIRIQVPLTLSPRMLLQIVLYCLLQVVKGYRARGEKKGELNSAHMSKSILEQVTHINKTKRYVGGTCDNTNKVNTQTNVTKNNRKIRINSEWKHPKSNGGNQYISLDIQFPKFTNCPQPNEKNVLRWCADCTYKKIFYLLRSQREKEG